MSHFSHLISVSLLLIIITLLGIELLVECVRTAAKQKTNTDHTHQNLELPKHNEFFPVKRVVKRNRGVNETLSFFALLVNISDDNSGFQVLEVSESIDRHLGLIKNLVDSEFVKFVEIIISLP